jgi:hypothetical protein
MIRISVAVLAVLLCCSLPVAVSAEGFLPGMPSFGGWSCAPAHKTNCSVAGWLGYLGYSRGLVFERGTVGPPNPGGVDTVRYQYPVEGIWLAASAAISGPKVGFAAYEPGEGLCLLLGASWLFPNNKQATETVNGAGGPGARTWSPTIQWYTLEAAVSRCSVQNFSLIGGFRYDSFSTKFADPVPVADFAASTSGDEAELNLTSYIPYVGAVTKWGAVEVGVIGFPWVPGAIEQRQTIGGSAVRYVTTGNYRNAYFLETWAEVGRQLGIVNLSAFATYTVLHAVGEFDFIRNPIAGASESAPNNFGLDRQNWIAGGKAMIGFNSPL